MHDAAWLHTIDPFVIEFAPGLGVRWYGLAYVAGFLVAWLMLRAMSRRGVLALSLQQVGDAMLALVAGVIVGGRLGYVLLYQPSLLVEFSVSPPWWGVLALNRGGMASHGGMIGVVLVCLWIARRARVSPLHILDAAVVSAPIGLFFGRIANFINGELLGRIVAAPGEPAPWWSVRFPQELLSGHAPELNDAQRLKLFELLDTVAPGWSADGGVGYARAVSTLIERVQRSAVELGEKLAPLLSARHPSQLYQAVAEGPVLLAALAMIWARPRRPGVVGAWFLMIYGALRIATEHWRLPDDHLATPTFLGLSRGQWFSAGMIVAGVVVLVLVATRSAHAPCGGWRMRTAWTHGQTQASESRSK